MSHRASDVRKPGSPDRWQPMAALEHLADNLRTTAGLAGADLAPATCPTGASSEAPPAIRPTRLWPKRSTKDLRQRRQGSRSRPKRLDSLQVALNGGAVIGSRIRSLEEDRVSICLVLHPLEPSDVRRTRAQRVADEA